MGGGRDSEGIRNRLGSGLFRGQFGFGGGPGALVGGFLPGLDMEEHGHFWEPESECENECESERPCSRKELLGDQVVQGGS